MKKHCPKCPFYADNLDKTPFVIVSDGDNFSFVWRAAILLCNETNSSMLNIIRTEPMLQRMLDDDDVVHLVTYLRTT